MSSPLLLITRPEESAQRFLKQVQDSAEGEFEAVVSPLMGITPVSDLPNMADFRGVIFTSRHGVAQYIAQGGRRDLPAYCVGPATCKEAAKAGFAAQDGGGTAEALTEYLLHLRPEAPLLHLRGEHSQGDLAAQLTQNGVSTQTNVLYRQPILPATAQAQQVLAGERPVVVPLFSARSARAFADLGSKSPLLVAALSQAVAKPVSSLHILAVRRADVPRASAMVELTLQLLEMAREFEACNANAISLPHHSVTGRNT